jgi:hypothetical protein
LLYISIPTNISHISWLSPFSEAYSRSDDQKFTTFYRVYKSPSLDPILSQTNPVHTLTTPRV